MKFDDYVTACLRTASMGLGPKVEMAVRALGLCGELVELKQTIGYGKPTDPLIKEAGDVLWYGAALASMFDLKGADLGVIEFDDFSTAPGELMDMTMREIVESAQDSAGAIAELVKKHVGHSKPADPLRIKILLRKIFTCVRFVVPIELGEVARLNVEKLKARYPAGFDMAIASRKADSDVPAVDIRPRNIDGDGRQVEEAEALAEPETVGHYPAGGVGEWKPGPV